MKSVLAALSAGAVLAFFCPFVASAQNATPPVRATTQDLPAMTPGQLAEANELLTPFFAELYAGRARQAFEILTADAMVGENSAWLSQMVAVTETLVTTYGGITRHELAESRCFTADICRNTYVLHTKTLPVFFVIGLYRREDGSWGPTQINLTDQTSQIF